MTKPTLFRAPPSRRDFLRHACGGALYPLSPFAASLAGMASASAASASDYRALVCVFLQGGNDAYNTVLATDSTSWSRYMAARGLKEGDGVALPPPGTPVSGTAPLGGVLPIVPTDAQGRNYALHPALGGLRDLFAAQRLAVVSNVGPLMRPTYKAAYQAGTALLPPKLFSHNDQTSVWQTMTTEGGAGLGWGGRMAERLASRNTDQRFTSISVDGNAPWLAGPVLPYQVSRDGPVHIGGADGTLFGSTVAQQKLLAVMRAARRDYVLEQDHAAVVARSIEIEGVLSKAIPAADKAPWGTPGTKNASSEPLLMYRDPSLQKRLLNPLAHQLQAVARTIAARTALGLKRQVFYVCLGGFDTHDDQLARHASGMAMLAHALTYFDTALKSMGVDQQVTTFTCSDFGRSFTSNGDGTDHGWGAHHFVMGGGVRGGNIYGRFPTYGAMTSDGFDSSDQVDNGSLLPITSVEQYAATFGDWLGLSNDELLAMMPALGKWPASSRKLDFMA